MSEKAWRVAVAETPQHWGGCDARIYISETEVRDYLDYTVAFCATESEANAVAEAELVRRQATYPEDSTYIF